MPWKVSVYRLPTKPEDPPLCDQRSLVSTRTVYGSSLDGVLHYLGMAPLTVTEKAINGINARSWVQSFSRLDRNAGTVVFFERG